MNNTDNQDPQRTPPEETFTPEEASRTVPIRPRTPARRNGRTPSRGYRGWNIGYFIKEGFFSIFKHGLMSFAAMCMIVACLLIMGTFSLVAVDLDVNRQKLEDENEFTAYVEDSLTLTQAQGLMDAITAIPNVRDATFVDRAEVLADFRAEHADEDGLFALLPDDVFQHRFRIHVSNIEDLETTAGLVGEIDGISDTSAQVDIAEGMVAVRNIAAGVALVLVSLLALVSLFIIANTLRLALFYRRDEIAIMKMCGASNSFIRWPFVTEGAILGLFSAVLAFFVQWLVYDLIANAMASGGQLSFLVVLPFSSLWGMVLAAFCGVGLTIGVLGSLLAIRRFLKV